MFRNTGNGKISAEELEAVRKAYDTFERLYTDIRTAIRIVPEFYALYIIAGISDIIDGTVAIKNRNSYLARWTIQNFYSGKREGHEEHY